MKKTYLLLLALVATFQTMLQAQTVTIGTQIWQTTNLNVDTYSDGTPIPQVTDSTAWVNLTTGAWCYYNNGSANGAIYGKLYNWYAVAGIYDAASAANPALRKKLAPTGWHVPTDAEWSTLINCLDPNANGGASANIAGDKMKSTTLWNPYSGITNTNSSGFTGLPGGYRDNSDTFNYIRGYGYWWSSSEYSAAGAWHRLLLYSGSNAVRDSNSKTYGFSVRCLSDQSFNVEDRAMRLQVKLYPNPANNTLQLQTASNVGIDKITITDLTGKVILTQTTNTQQVEVASLANGMYMIEAVSGGEKFTSKFIKE